MKKKYDEIFGVIGSVYLGLLLAFELLKKYLVTGHDILLFREQRFDVKQVLDISLDDLSF